MARTKTTNWLLGESLAVSLLVLVLSEMAQSSYSFGTSTLEDGSPCNKEARTIPEMYVVNSTALKCIFRHPIWWDVKNDVGGGLRIHTYGNDTTRTKLDWKSCDSSNQATGTITDVTVYFETILVTVQPDVISFNVSCVSATNSAQSYAKWIAGQNATLVEQNNSKGGMVMFQNQSKAPCLHVILASDYKHSKFDCIVGLGRQSNSPGAQYLECPDWIKCKQLVSQTFKGICKGVLTRDLCNTEKSCANRSSAFNSGIIYCGNGTEQDPAFYMLSFMSMKTETGDYYSSHMISDDDGGFNGKSLVSLKSSWTAYGSEQRCTHDKPVILNCTAPKFLALERFQWTASYVGGSSIDIRKACRTTHGSANDTYIETLSCVLPEEDAPRDIQVNCTVHLQSGHPVTNTVTKKCPAVLSLSDEQFEKALFSIFGVAGCLLLTLPFLIFYYCKVQRQKSVIRSLTKDEVYEFFNGARNKIFNHAAVVPENLAFNEDLKISRSDLILENLVLGKGQYGVVRQGAYRNQEVAVKSCKSSADIEYFRSFLKELKVIAYIGEHPNIVKFFGAVVDNIEKGEGFAVMELSPWGNLNCYLRKHSKTYEDPGPDKLPCDSSRPDFQLSIILNEPTLISFCKQIATGMEYLAERKVTHADLATRNVLVFEGNVVKIADFGLSRKLYDYSNYTKKNRTPLPWRWMALESLRLMEFSTQSDVWSFGVTVWEIFSLGQVPFPGSSWATVFMDQLEAGTRLSRPPLAQQAVYEFLMKCWDKRPDKRPTFTECKGVFMNMECAMLKKYNIYGTFLEGTETQSS